MVTIIGFEDVSEGALLKPNCNIPAMCNWDVLFGRSENTAFELAPFGFI
jgi:hypothetical protein